MSQEHRANHQDSAYDEDDEMKPEYQFDYAQAKPNRFAQRQRDGSLVVVLEPDIAQIFRTPEAVKKVLRALIATMPPTSVTPEQ